MEGYFRRRGCVCWKAKCTCGAENKKLCTCGANKVKIKNCICGAKWSFTIQGKEKPDGSRSQITRSGFNTKDEAKKAAISLQYEMDQGTYIEESNTTFREFAPEWKSTYAATNQVKKGTLRIRQHEIDKLMPYFDSYKVKDVTKKMYQDALNDLSDKGFAYSTICGVHSTGRMIFKKAKEWDMLKSDPTEFARVPKRAKTVEELEQEEELPTYMEKEELNLFLKTAKKHGTDNDYAMFLTLAYSGVRDGELSVFKDTDLKVSENTISVTKTHYNPSNNVRSYELVTPKTVASKRTIEIDPAVTNELKKIITKNKKVKLRLGDKYHDQGFIFTSPKYPGYPILVKTIEYKMNRLLKLAKLNENLTPHSLRHTHVSLLAEAGVGLEEIMERMGHTDDDTTRNIYLHVTKTMKKEASRKFSELMKRP